MEKGVISISVVSIAFFLAFFASNAKAGHYDEDWGSYGEKGTFIAPPVDSYYGYYPPQSARIYVDDHREYYSDYDDGHNDDAGYYPPRPARIYIGDYGRDDNNYDNNYHNGYDAGYYPPPPARIHVNSGINDNNYDNHYPPPPPRIRVDDGRSGNRNNHRIAPTGNYGSRGYNRY